MEEMTFIPVPSMEFFPFGLTFFGERNPVYVSQKVYDDIPEEPLLGMFKKVEETRGH